MLQRYDLGSNEGEILCKRCHSEPASRQLLQGSNRRVLVKAVNGPGQELVRAWPGWWTKNMECGNTSYIS